MAPTPESNGDINSRDVIYDCKDQPSHQTKYKQKANEKTLAAHIIQHVQSAIYEMQKFTMPECTRDARARGMSQQTQLPNHDGPSTSQSAEHQTALRRL